MNTTALSTVSTDINSAYIQVICTVDTSVKQPVLSHASYFAVHLSSLA